jgi:hypothetical protein
MKDEVDIRVSFTADRLETDAEDAKQMIRHDVPPQGW